MIHIYRSLYMLFFPFFIFFGLLFSKKTKSYLLHRQTNLAKSTNLQPILIHASSGEFEHAKFLIKSLKEKYPLQKIVISYSSPSYFNAIKNFEGIDGYIPMPADLKAPIHSFLKRVNPKIVLFARTDLWPEFMHQLENKKIPSLIFARMERNKVSVGDHLLNSMTYKKVDHISFVSENDKELYLKKFHTKDSQQSLSVDGDPRIEEVIERAAKTNLHLDADTRTLVLGSVWSEDLKQTTKAILDAFSNKSLQRVIIAPHEPTTDHIKEIRNLYKSKDISLYSEDPALKSSVVIVDSIGVLFDLYAKADLAFVGGSFKKKVHSVIEPLAHGIPVLVGPFIGNNTEAKIYSQKEEHFVHVSRNKDEFSKNLFKLLKLDSEQSTKLKKTIKENLLKKEGASNRIIKLIEEKVELYS